MTTDYNRCTPLLVIVVRIVKAQQLWKHQQESRKGRRRKVVENQEAEEEPDRDQTSGSGPTTLHANRVQEQNHGAARFGHQSCHSKSIDRH